MHAASRHASLDEGFMTKMASSSFGIQPDGSGLRQITQAKPGQAIRGARWTPDRLEVVWRG